MPVDMASSAGRLLKDCRRVGRVLSESGLVGGSLRLVARLAGGSARRRIVTAPVLYRAVTRRTAALIALSERFRNRHRGSIAFVVATGPSVARQDLSQLASGIVIGVNENFSYLKSRGVKVAYNVAQDDGYFDDPGYRAFWQELGEAARCTGMTPVIPAFSTTVTAGSAAWRGVDPAYFLQVGEFLAVTDTNQLMQIDFSRPMPSYLTVTHTAIAWAMFLGCSEIKVLGVDLDHVENLSAPMRHCYGRNPYNDHDRSPASVAFALNSRVPRFDLQARSFDKLAEIARRQSQSIIDAGLRGRAGNLPKRPLPTLEASPPD